MYNKKKLYRQIPLTLCVGGGGGGGADAPHGVFIELK